MERLVNRLQFSKTGTYFGGILPSVDNCKKNNKTEHEFSSDVVTIMV